MNLVKGKDVLVKSSKDKKELLMRIISAIFIVGIIYLIFFKIKGSSVPIFISFIAILMTFEWEKMFYKKLTSSGLILAFNLLTIIYFTHEKMYGAALVMSFISFPILLIINKFYKHKYSILYSLGALYLGLPIYSILYVYDKAKIEALLWTILIVSGTDTGAYFLGKLFKGPKLAPKISPSKTWSGAIGGVIFSNLMVISILPFILPEFSYKKTSLLWASIILITIFSIFSILGDLFESFIKRKTGVKNSSNLIPGHGGILDRTDSLLFVLPIIAFTTWLAYNYF